ncbi:MAG: LUD domain-containing protein [Rothia sp. (in: high G+C Gram-positive bacteria)]|uniref:LutC/YkgG family protein n=1 Tax=Rothia sp. (in: high G+C Gram-positive bacteria) TaxID=1885016 RepID=UPI0026E007FB|nr:LUD domain-containing protein [Rothia sp. (in: high G+C Gram-positive bacteria)]MDO5749862.1 LUD domain-containing protein [Rothia sp. (in: high G+C Gram-positive bacteria)]
MSDAKSVILGRIRSALSDGFTAPEPVRNYRRVSQISQEDTIEMLIDRLIDYKANVFQATEDTLASVIAERLGEKSTYVIPVGLKDSWLPADTADRKRVVDSGSTLKEHALSHRELDEVDAVVTSSTVSCAETGTIFLNSNPDEGRRAISLVPDHHICVVSRDSVVELVPEAIERITYERPVTMISGPSATSDIELIRVEGVHGPRTLDVIILN